MVGCGGWGLRPVEQEAWLSLAWMDSTQVAFPQISSWDCPGSLLGASRVSVGWTITGRVGLTPTKVAESVPHSCIHTPPSHSCLKDGHVL